MSSKSFSLLSTILALFIFVTASSVYAQDGSVINNSVQNKLQINSNPRVVPKTTNSSTQSISGNSATIKTDSAKTQYNQSIKPSISTTQPGLSGYSERINVKRAPTLITAESGPGLTGVVKAVDGQNITVKGKSWLSEDEIAYAVDASKAELTIKGKVNPTISDIKVGDNIIIQGAINGTTVIASSITDQKGEASDQKVKVGFWRKITNGVRGVVGGIGSFFKNIFGI